MPSPPDDNYCIDSDALELKDDREAQLTNRMWPLAVQAARASKSVDKAGVTVVEAAHVAAAYDQLLRPAVPPVPAATIVPSSWKGWRLFACDKCGDVRKKATRDRHSPSEEGCDCGEVVMPMAEVADMNLVTDMHGNLVGEPPDQVLRHGPCSHPCIAEDLALQVKTLEALVQHCWRHAGCNREQMAEEQRAVYDVLAAEAAMRA